MATELNQTALLSRSIPDSDESMRETLEYFIPVFLRDQGTTIVNIDPVQADRYKGDYYGLMKEIGSFPESIWWLSMRMIGIESPMDYDGETTSLLRPDETLLTRIINVAKTTKGG